MKIHRLSTDLYYFISMTPCIGHISFGWLLYEDDLRISDLILDVSQSSVTDLILSVLNTIREKWTILDDIIFSVYLYPLMTWYRCPHRHWEFSPQIWEPGVPAFCREKLAAAPICHQLSGQMSLFFTGSQQDGWSHFISAVWGHSGSTALHASLTASPPPPCLPTVTIGAM